MNSFVRHHHESIRFGYRCFDRILFNLMIQHLQVPGAVIAFLKRHRQVSCVTPNLLKSIAGAYHTAIELQAQQLGIPVVEPPTDKNVRREEWVQQYFQQLGGRDGVAVILKSREPARMAICRGRDSYSLDFAWRHVCLYYFYLQQPSCGRMFLKLCPYFPFNGQVYVNGHEWLARRLQQEGIAFVKKDNAFVDCADPRRLQELADQFSPEDVRGPVDALLGQWLGAALAPHERALGYRHRLFVAQVEYCDNLIFHKGAALERLFDRLLDLNRSIGQPEKLAVVFRRPSFRPDIRSGETIAKLLERRVPVIRSGFQHTSVKQYVKDGVLLRTETASYQLRDLSLRKDIRHLPRLRRILAQSNERYQNAQQDVLATYVDRGQLAQLRQPTISPTGRRTPGLRLDDLRVLAVWQAMLGIIHLIGHGTFRTKDLLSAAQAALKRPDYKLSQLRYDLAKLRGKGLVERVHGTQQYRLTPDAYRLGVLYYKLYHRLYAPLTSALLSPLPQDCWLSQSRQSRLDRLYRALDRALQNLHDKIGLRDSA